jgi:hypothetical protein
MKEHFTLRYSSTNGDTNDTIMELDMNFDNPSKAVLIDRINIWLTAIGRSNLIIIDKYLISKKIISNVDISNNNSNTNANISIDNNNNDDDDSSNEIEDANNIDELDINDMD